MSGDEHGERGAPRSDAEMEETMRLLETVAREEQLVMEQADGLDDAPGLDRVQAVLEREWAAEYSTAHTPATRWWPIGTVAAAAAAVLIAVFAPFGGVEKAPGPGPAGVVLASGELVAVHPPPEAEGAVAAWDRIEWTGPADARYTVSVTRADDGGELLETQTEGTALDLGARDTAAWGDRIQVWVGRHADGGTSFPEQLEWIARRERP